MGAGSAQAGRERAQSIPGMAWISGRKRTGAGTADDKSLHWPLAEVLCVLLNMGVCDFFGGSTSTQTTHAWSQRS